MDAISTLDTVFFLNLSAFMMVYRAPVESILFAIGAIPYILTRMPYDIGTQRLMRSYDERTVYGRNTTLYQYVIVELVAWTMATFDPSSVGGVFFSESVSRGFYLFRKYRLGHAELGDSRITATEEEFTRGIWVHSPTRDLNHDRDLVVYFVHGGGFTKTSVYFYTEYLLAMLVCLQLEGFKNPAIFALEYTQIPEAHVGQQLDEVAAGWTYLSQTEGYPRIALIGDSNGATLILSLLLHIVHPYSKSVPIARRQPDAAIVISPLTRIAGPWNSSSSDYITQKVLDRYMRKYAQDFRADSTDPHVSPGLCRSKFWWSKAIPPRGGMYIIYGQEETLAPDIEELYQLVKNLGHVGRLAEPFEIHAWPIVQNYVAETKQKRLRGVTTVTSQLSKMLLWSTITEPPAEMLDEIRRETAEVYKLQHERIARIKEKATGVADNNQ